MKIHVGDYMNRDKKQLKKYLKESQYIWISDKYQNLVNINEDDDDDDDDRLYLYVR